MDDDGWMDCYDCYYYHYYYYYYYLLTIIRHRAPGTKWVCLVTERSEFDDVNTQRSMMSTIYDASYRWWTGQRSFLGPTYPPADSGHLPATPPLAFLKSLFRLPTSASKFISFSKPQNPPKIVQKAPKTVPKTLPKRVQNSVLSYYARNPQKMHPSYTKT